MITGTVCALALSFGLMTSPASAQLQAGLVNVNVSDIEVETGDILSENNVVVPIGVAAGIAANICDLTVGVLASQIARGEDVNCSSDVSDTGVRQDVKIPGR
jgi:hypothetical protein